MLKHRWIDKICLTVMAAAVIVTLLFMNGETLGIKPASSLPGYVNRLFDANYVHTIDLEVENWEELLTHATEEQYVPCNITIDGESYHNIGLRFKGNNSLRLTNQYDLQRFSMKIEMDHYTANHYYGLDKFSLDSSFQDNSYMKNWLTYDMMRFMNVPTPLCSYTWVTVNGEDWGLFLAVEEPEEAFAKRNFGENFGQLYKPDYKKLNDENADVALCYINDDPENYDNIFRNAKFDITNDDKMRVIAALKALSEGENLERAINLEEVLRYFTVQVFVVNMDSYLGRTGHNYFLYEEDGRLSILPWDYNLAFATYSLGMPNPVNDAEKYVNHPINTPADGAIMLKRPLYHNVMLQNDNFVRYHQLFDELITEYFESGLFQHRLYKTADMIAPYVKMDPTSFCSYEDHILAADTLEQFCLLRAESVRRQLDGNIPATIRGQLQDRSNFVDASSIWLPDLGEIADLKN